MLRLLAVGWRFGSSGMVVGEERRMGIFGRWKGVLCYLGMGE